MKNRHILEITCEFYTSQGEVGGGGAVSPFRVVIHKNHFRKSYKFSIIKFFVVLLLQWVNSLSFITLVVVALVGRIKFWRMCNPFLQYLELDIKNKV